MFSPFPSDDDIIASGRVSGSGSGSGSSLASVYDSVKFGIILEEENVGIF